MSWKTIVVPLDSGSRCPERIAVAAALAARHDSHVIGIAAAGIPDYVVPLETPMHTPELYAASRAEVRRRAEQLAEAFERQVREIGAASFESRVLIEEPLDAAVRLGRCADLIVLGQTNRKDTPSGIAWDFPQQVVIHSGTPTLVVPYAGRFGVVGNSVLVAWKNTREAAAALHAALPLLQAARNVRLCTFREPGEIGSDDDLLRDARSWLRRHGVDAEARSDATGIDAAEALLSRAFDFGADCIVAGAYGHTRLREWALGGFTRSLLEHMTVPTLMAH